MAHNSSVEPKEKEAEFKRKHESDFLSRRFEIAVKLNPNQNKLFQRHKASLKRFLAFFGSELGILLWRNSFACP